VAKAPEQKQRRENETKMNPESTSLCAEVSGLGLVAAASIPALRRIVQRLFLSKRRHYHPRGERYEDKDGVAAEISVKAFSDKIQRGIIACCSVIGLSASLGLAMIATLRQDQALDIAQWLRFATWVGLWSMLSISFCSV
jgi:hypothetical protein